MKPRPLFANVTRLPQGYFAADVSDVYGQVFHASADSRKEAIAKLRAMARVEGFKLIVKGGAK